MSQVMKRSKKGHGKRLGRRVGTRRPSREVRRGEGSDSLGAQPVMLAAPVSMCPVARRLHAESELTVTVKSYHPLSYATALK
ncbi:hypothetical protein ABH920_004071 [Catenulispora sp. EB89]